MSMEMHVLLKDTKIPGVQDWQKAITNEGFALTLDSTMSVREDEGFSPVVYNGTETGFEFDIFSANSITDTYPEVSDKIGDRNMSANFRWSGDTTECIAVCIAAAVLAKLTDGVLFESDAGEFYQNEAAIKMAKDTIQSFENE